MDIIEETKRALATLNPREKESRIDDLDWLFEKGGFKKADVGQAASFMLLASLDERDERVKETIFSALKTAVSWNDISEYIDWDVVIRQLSFLSLNGLMYALGMLGWSKRITDISILKQYLDHDHLAVQTCALDSICQIWWDASGRDPEAKALMNIEAQRRVDFLIGNPKKHDVSESKITGLFQEVCAEVIENMEKWFDQHR
ncbi:hypothetical protein [Dictyobacter formicarum]|uniref:Uncharacterized protein n=1 Tax=Dictyobacter formicarum TaxID=2778368 RepID=A0ABQ3VNX9_9CHLR|nr:hypothetical protein [Dictyobacter formicarum]GHO87547.1 hypothetical protein KSZ_55530 [Dictyobacter formicarum]